MTDQPSSSNPPITIYHILTISIILGGIILSLLGIANDNDLLITLPLVIMVIFLGIMGSPVKIWGYSRDVGIYLWGIRKVGQSTDRASAIIVAGLLWVGFGAIAYGAYELKGRDVFLPLTQVWILWVTGFLFIWLGVTIGGISFPELINREFIEDFDSISQGLQLCWTRILTGLALILIVAEANGHIIPLSFLAKMPHHLQFVGLLAGVGLIFWGGSGDCDTGLRVRFNYRKLDWTLIGIGVFALIVRLWQLESGLRISIDEINFALPTLYATLGSDFKILAPLSGVAAFPAVYPYMQSLIASVVGGGLLSLRLLSVAFGTLTIVSTYYLLAALFNRRIGLLTALLLATFPPHLHFSRIGMNNIADPLFGVTTLWLLVRGLQTRRQIYFVAAGVAFGFTQYFYEVGKLFYPVLILGWVGIYLAQNWRKLDRQFWHNVMLFIATFVVIAMPVYYTLYGLDLPFTPRMDDANINGKDWIAEFVQDLQSSEDRGLLVERAKISALHFVRVPDGSYFYGDTILVFAIVPLFLTGLALILTQRHLVSILFLMWLIGTVMANSLIRDNYQTTRFIISFPVIVILIILAIYYLLPRMLLLDLWLSPHYQPYIIILATLMIVFGHWYFYMYDYLPSYRESSRIWMGSPDYYDVAYRSKDFPKGTVVHTVSDHLADYPNIHGLLSFFHPDWFMVDTRIPETFTEGYVSSLDRSVDHAFYIQRDHPEILAVLETVFGNLPEPLGSPYNVPEQHEFLLYYIKSES